MTDILIKIEDLCLYFRTGRGIVQAVDKVSFTLNRGSSMVIVGESDCGKTSW